jgi:hypothetical protein
MVSIKKFQDFLIREAQESPEDILFRKINQIELQLKKLFGIGESGEEITKFGDNEEGSEIFKGLELVSIDKSKASKRYKDIKLIFSDDEYRYDMIFSIDLAKAIAPEGQSFDDTTLTTCDVKFKRYADGTEPIGEITMTDVDIDKINEDFFEDILAKLEESYPSEEPSEEEFQIITDEEKEGGEEE